MNVNRLAYGRNPAATRKSDVDMGWDDVSQLVAGERCNKAERAAWRSKGNLQQILIDLGRIGPAI
jgi:hypothetical protein